MAVDHEYVKSSNVKNVNNIIENINITTMENDMNININEENFEFEISTSYKEGDELLIDLVKSYPHLWDKEDKDYKDLNKRDNFWEEIGKIMHLSVKECLSRWCRLRQYYAKERQDQENIPSGSANNKRRPWELFQNMSFIDRHMHKRKRKYTNIKNVKSFQLNDLSEDTASNQRSPLNNITNQELLLTLDTPEIQTHQSSTLTTSIDSELTPTDSQLQLRSLEWQPIRSPVAPSSRPQSLSSSSSQETMPSSQSIKRKNKFGSSDMLEKSFNVVSESISAMATQIFTNENKNDRDEALAKMILAELKSATEPKKTELRKKLINVIVEHMSL